MPEEAIQEQPKPFDGPKSSHTVTMKLEAPEVIDAHQAAERAAASSPVKAQARKERKQPTDEEVEKELRSISDMLFPGPKKKEEPKQEEVQKEEPAPAEEEKPADEPKTEEAETKRKPKVTKRPKPRQVDEETLDQISRTAASAATEALKQRDGGERKEAEVKDELDDLDESDRRKVQVLREMESNPRYKDVSKKYVQFVRKEAQYQEQWLKDHPGEDFDPDSSDHVDFYRRHEPEIDPDDYTETVAEIKARKIVEKQSEKLSKRHEELEQKIIERELEPRIAATADQAVYSLVASVDDNLGKMLKEKGPDALKEEDPIAYEVLEQFGSVARGMTYEFTKITENPRYAFDSKNPIHADLERWINSKYSELDGAEWDGKSFVPWGQYQKLTPAQQRSHWSYSPQELRGVLVEDLAERAKQAISQQKQKIEAYIKRTGAAKPSQAGGASTAEPAKKATPKPSSPSSSSGMNATPKLEASKEAPKKQDEEIANILWG